MAMSGKHTGVNHGPAVSYDSGNISTILAGLNVSSMFISGTTFANHSMVARRGRKVKLNFMQRSKR